MRPLISDAVGAALSLLRFREFLKDVRVKFRSEGVESEEVSELPLEGVEVLEWPSEGVSGKGSEWMEHAVALGTVGRNSG